MVLHAGTKKDRANKHHGYVDSIGHGYGGYGDFESYGRLGIGILWVFEYWSFMVFGYWGLMSVWVLESYECLGIGVFRAFGYWDLMSV